MAKLVIMCRFQSWKKIWTINHLVFWWIRILHKRSQLIQYHLPTLDIMAASVNMVRAMIPFKMRLVSGRRVLPKSKTPPQPSATKKMRLVFIAPAANASLWPSPNCKENMPINTTVSNLKCGWQNVTIDNDERLPPRLTKFLSKIRRYFLLSMNLCVSVRRFLQLFLILSRSLLFSFLLQQREIHWLYWQSRLSPPSPIFLIAVFLIYLYFYLMKKSLPFNNPNLLNNCLHWIF